MNSEQRELWTKIEGHVIGGEGLAFPFAAKLAKENGWSREFAERAIIEYKRFVFLGRASGHPVSPSDVIDQVWHMHLIYSEDYWTQFCPHVLGRPFHHHPSKGGEDESAKFEDWYAKTLYSYGKLFGAEPPTDVWPDPETRRQMPEAFTRVDKVKNWVIRKPKLKITPLGLLFLPGLIAVGCTAQTDPLNMAGPDFLVFYFFLYAATLLAAIIVKWLMSTPGGGDKDVPLSPYEIAYLNGGKDLAVNVGMASMVIEGSGTVGTGKSFQTSMLEFDGSDPIRQAISQAASDKARPAASVRKTVAPVTGIIDEQLKSQGLLVGSAQGAWAVAVSFVISMVAPAIGLAKIGVGVSREKPILFLAIFCGVSLVVNLFTFLRRPHRSRYGDKVLRHLREKFSSTRKLSALKGEVGIDQYMMGMGLFGLTCLVSTPYSSVHSALQPPTSSGSDSGDSSSCSSGDSGGSSCGGGGCGAAAVRPVPACYWSDAGTDLVN